MANRIAEIGQRGVMFIMNETSVNHKRIVVNELLKVKVIWKLSNNLIRIVFSSDKPLAINPQWIGPHVKLLFPNASGEIIFPAINEENKIIWQEGMRQNVRTYSIRNYSHYNYQEYYLTIDFVIHSAGIATTWAQQANIGDVIGLVGMGAKKTFDKAEQLFFVGDISAMPAISYSLEHLPADQKALAIIEVPHQDDILPLQVSSTVQIEWLVTSKGKSQLLAKVASIINTVKHDKLLIWGGMESSICQQIRQYLIDQFPDLPREVIQLIGYWREGFAEGEFKHHD